MRIRRKPLGDVPTYKSKLYGSQPLGTRSDLNEDPLYSMVALDASSFKASIVSLSTELSLPKLSN